MKKWLLLSLSFTSLLFPVEKDDMNTYEIETNVKGMKYGLYTDIECKNPLYVDEEEIIVEMNEENSQTITTDQEKIYIKQIETVDGYFLDPDVYVLEEKTTLPTYPITMKYTSDIYPVSYHLYDGNEEVNQWSANEESTPDIVYQAGKSYTLRYETKDPYTKNEMITFDIPKERDESFQNEVHVVYQNHGIISVNVRNEKQEGLKGVKYALYLDQETREICKDMNGGECIGISDDKGNILFHVDEGTYYLKQIEIAEDYYLNQDVVEVKVEKKKTTELTTQENSVNVSITLRDEDIDEEIDAKVWVDGLNQVVTSGEQIHLKRNTEYTVKDVEHPSGYHGFGSVTYKTSETKKDERIVISYQPFQIYFQVCDIDTNLPLLGSQYSIYDENDDLVLSFDMNEDVYQTNRLHDGMRYTIKETRNIEGYQKMDDISFEIENNKETHVNGTKIPYTSIHSNIVDDKGNQIDGTIGLYYDEACKKVVKDLNGKDVLDINDKNVRNGMYYAKLESLEPHYAWNDEIRRVNIDHQNDSVIYKVKHVGIDIFVQTNKGTKLEDVEIELLDEDGNSLSTFKNQSFYDSSAYSFLERDKIYGFRIYSIDGTYTYEKKVKSVTLPKDTSITFECNPYISLNVKGYGTYGLYDDSRCLELSEDIYGNETKKNGDSILWLMREGTYYLKQLETTGGNYPNVEVQEIQLKEGTWAVKKEIKSDQITLNIQINDGIQDINDAKYEMIDEEGNVKDIISTTIDSYQADWLKPGKPITFHEVQTPPGYQSNSTDIIFTIPETAPTSTPSILLTYEKEVSKATSKKQNDVDEIEKKESFPWILITCSIVGTCILAGYIVYRNKK